MADTLCFVHTPGSSGEEQAVAFADRGWNIQQLDPNAEDAIAAIEASQPLATIFCLESECGATRDFAVRVLEDTELHRPLMIFVGGQAEEVEAAKEAVPFGVFVSPSELHWVIKRLVFNE